jgi:hypothetical protein
VEGAEIMTTTSNESASSVTLEFPVRTKAEILIEKGFKPLSINPERERKKALLETPMHLLGLDTCFCRYFFDRSGKKYFVDGVFREMNSKDVITLQEFINANPAPKKECVLITRREPFCPKKHSLYSKTTSFYNLLSFLRAEGFTLSDWLALAPKGAIVDVCGLSKDKIVPMPALILLGSYEKCDPAKILVKYFKKKITEITVEDLLTIGDNEVDEVASILGSLQRMQRRLRRFGFNDSDGEFMRAHLDL